MVTIGSLFAGIGGFDYAFEAAGFSTAWQVERDAFCLKVLAKHFPDAQRYADIYDCHDLPYVDVITAGFPCQPFSVAGSRKGADDERYLIPEMLRVIREVQPRVVLLENVPGFASLNDGAEFRKLLQALAEMGFDAEWGCVSAADAGAPHLRERWLCVAYANGRRQQERYPTERRLPIIDAHGGATVADTNQLRPSTGNGRATHDAQRGDCQRALVAQRQRLWAIPSGAGIRIAERTTQPRIRGNAHGLSAGLDRHIFPARPGEAQHPFEPARTVGKGETADRAARLKALGNAVVPQCVYPVACAIREFLQGVGAQKVKAA